VPAGDISLGLVGVGNWGRKIANTVAAMPGIRLAAAASRNLDVASLLPADCRIHSDWRELVAADDLQGIIIATPSQLHGEMLVAAVEAGKAVLVEKPLVASRGQGDWLRSRMGTQAATILVDHIHLFHPAFRALQREAARLGSLRKVQSAAGKLDDSCRGLDLLWDWAPHDLSMCLALAPGAVRVAGARWLDEGRASLDFNLSLAGGATAHVELSVARPRHRWFAAMYDGGTLVYRDGEVASVVRMKPGDDIHAAGEPIPFEPVFPLPVAISSFADSIRRQDTARNSFDLGLSVVDMSADIEDSLSQIGH
jgi:UDP-2-acetamido-3-amino-2,3-dideoxy-glucuronate N-acetyltransferase